MLFFSVHNEYLFEIALFECDFFIDSDDIYFAIDSEPLHQFWV